MPHRGPGARKIRAGLKAQLAVNAANPRTLLLTELGAVKPPSMYADAVKRPTRQFNTVWGQEAAFMAAVRYSEKDKRGDAVARLRTMGYGGSKDNCTFFLFGPAAGFQADPNGLGMPADEAAVFFLPQAHGSPAVDCFYDAIFEHFDALGYTDMPQRMSIKFDFMLLRGNVQVAAPGAAVPPMNNPALFGHTVVNVPYSLMLPKSIVNLATLRQGMVALVAEFIARVDEQLNEDNPGSNGVMLGVLGAYMWAYPTGDAAAGGGVYGGKRARDGACASLLPLALRACGGLAFNDPTRDAEGTCIARAILMGLDAVNHASSDTHVDYLHSSVLAAKLSPEDRVQVTAWQSQANATLLRQGRVVRPRAADGSWADTSSKWDTSSSFKRVESALGRAFKNEYSWVDLSDPFFKEAQPLSPETFRMLQASARVGADDIPKVRFQLWGLGNAGKIGMHYREAWKHGSEYEYLMAGGVLVNLLFAEGHCYWIRNVSACMNHYFGKEGAAERHACRRAYCSLCGFHVTSHAGYAFKLLEHQREGCNQEAPMRIPAPLSPAGRKQLSAFDFQALHRPLVMASLALGDGLAVLETEASLCVLCRVPVKGELDSAANIDPTSCIRGWARFPLTWHESEPCEFDPRIGWEQFHTRYHFMHEADMAHVSDVVDQVLEDCAFLTRPTLRRVLATLAETANVDALLQRMHFVGPRCHVEYARCIAQRLEEVVCMGCKLPVMGPSKWQLQARCAAAETRVVDLEDEACESEDEDASIDAESIEGPAPEFVGANGHKAVIDHCHATGACAWAHVDCNSKMRQSTETLFVEVDGPQAMYGILATVCERAFVTGCLDGRLPSCSEKNHLITRIVIYLPGSARMDSKGETRKRYLKVVFRPRDAFFKQDLVEQRYAVEDGCPPTSSGVRAESVLREFVLMAETEFRSFGLWLPTFATMVTASRKLLEQSLSSVLPPGETLTVLSSAHSLKHARQLLLGGRNVMGEFAELPLKEPRIGDEPLKVYDALFDKRAAYPSLLFEPLPVFEHLDRRIHDFSSCVAEGISFLQSYELETDRILRVTISGSFPPELHASIGRLCPVQSRLPLLGGHLSAFQRTFMNKGLKDPLGTRSVAHLWPVDKIVVFVREVKFWLRLGFVLTFVGDVYATPAMAWARPFAQKMEALRKAASLRKDKQAEEVIKLECNSLVGSWNINVAKFNRLVPSLREDDVEDEEDEEVSASASKSHSRFKYRSYKQQLFDDPTFTGRVFTESDVDFVELRPGAKKYSSLLVAFAYVHAMSRLTLYELYWGSVYPVPRRGLRDIFPEHLVGYGCTDSLVFRAVLPKDAPFVDVRHMFACFMDNLDISNVPDASTFWEHLDGEMLDRFKDVARRRAYSWGMWVEQTGFGGLRGVIVNGSNRWSWDAEQHPRDTLDTLRGAQSCVLKSIPKAWQGLFTFEDYARSWYGVQQPTTLPPVPSFRAPARGQLRSTDILVEKKVLSVWGNVHCIVMRAGGRGVQFTLGSQQPEALAAVAGTAW